MMSNEMLSTALEVTLNGASNFEKIEPFSKYIAGYRCRSNGRTLAIERERKTGLYIWAEPTAYEKEGVKKIPYDKTTPRNSNLNQRLKVLSVGNPVDYLTFLSLADARDFLNEYAGELSPPTGESATAMGARVAAAMTPIESLSVDEPDSTNAPVESDDEASEAQGYEPDPFTRKAIEQFAVAWARKHYERNGYGVAELGKPFDLLCKKSGEIVHVEVKGSRGNPAEAVFVTINEVTDARDPAWRSDLFLVDRITVEYDEKHQPKCGGGRARIAETWFPKSEDLSPLQYRYRLPPMTSVD